MNPLISILHYGHCRSTHHYFAVDAIPHVRTDAGRRMTKILLRYHDDYLRGAKDPDTRFRDFQNHVIHVNDGYWGGAPRVAHQWYDRMQKYLQAQKWRYAAHAAGVLSHYFTDPMMPLHTQQSSREKILHRPIEWSVTKSYHEIMELWRCDRMQIVFEMSDRPEWLGEAILHAARYANQYYAPLLETYDLGRGRRNPKQGLSLIAKQSLAELFGMAITGWARVLERAASEAENKTGRLLPQPSIALSSVLLTSRVPLRLLGKRISDRTERIAVESLISEFERTGDLREHLPAEVDVVHRVVQVHHGERAWLQRREQLRSKETVVDVQTAPHTKTLQQDATHRDATKQDTTPPSTIPMPTRASSFRRTELETRLQHRDLLERAPSIGPKTAARFAQIGITTVGEFLRADASEMAIDLATRWIKESVIQLWQRQATLMCEVPALSALDSQLLAGVGCTDRKILMTHDAESMTHQIEHYAGTSAGRRYLRGGKIPNVTDIKQWIDLAKQYDDQLTRNPHNSHPLDGGSSHSAAA